MKLRAGEVVIETDNIEIVTKETDHNVTMAFSLSVRLKMPVDYSGRSL